MLSAKPAQGLPSELLRIIAATHHDPFEVLGRHPLPTPTTTADTCIRVFLPGASNAALHLEGQRIALERIEGTDFFEWFGLAKLIPAHYQVEWTDRHNNVHTEFDPYSFAPQLGELDMHLFGEGQHWDIYQVLGAHPKTVDGIDYEFRQQPFVYRPLTAWESFAPDINLARVRS